MLARLQQLTVLGLLFGSLAWAVYFVSVGRWGWALAGPIAVAAVYAGALGVEFFWLRRSYPPGSEEQPGAVELLRAWLAETTIAPVVFLWRQPFRSRAIADAAAEPAPGRRGVVLVHGFFCNRGLWNPWMQRFRALDIPYVAVSLEPVFGSIDGYVDRLEAAVAQVERATGLAPVLVAHSMGGLAVRAWLARRGGPERFHHAVTVASPHHGTWMARHARTTNGRQMRPDSPWLAALEATEAAELYARFTCFWSRCDNIVFPTTRATLPGAENRHLAGTPHVRMAYHPEVFETVLRLVRAAGSS